jgi:ferric-dicitrate binding protein FerR (iron transport regulator)
MKTPWELIAKYLTNEASESERIELEKWSKSDKANFILLERLKLVYQLKHNTLSIDFSQFQHEDWEKLQQKTINVGAKQVRWLPIWKIAASISLIIISFISIIYFNKQQPLLEIATTNDTKEVWLPDSSYVLLNKDSRLIVEGAYNEETRKVSLIGEAYFKVKSNPASPFSISSFGVNTTVLGTQFNIKAKADSTITVSVLEGKVSVVANHQEEILTANTATVYDGHRLQFLENADPNYLAWKTGIVQFKSKPLSEVVKFLSAHYNKSISIEKNIDSSLLITVELNNLSLDQSLEIISSTLDLHFTREARGYVLK